MSNSEPLTDELDASYQEELEAESRQLEKIGEFEEIQDRVLNAGGSDTLLLSNGAVLADYLADQGDEALERSAPLQSALAHLQALAASRTGRPGVDLTPAVLVKELGQLAEASSRADLNAVEARGRESSGRLHYVRLLSNLRGEVRIATETLEARVALAKAQTETQLEEARHRYEKAVGLRLLDEIALPAKVQRANNSAALDRIKNDLEHHEGLRDVEVDARSKALQRALRDELLLRDEQVITLRRQANTEIDEGKAAIDLTHGVAIKLKAHWLAVNQGKIANLKTAAAQTKEERIAITQLRRERVLFALSTNRKTQATVAVLATAALIAVSNLDADRPGHADDFLTGPINDAWDNLMGQGEETSMTVRPVGMAPGELPIPSATSIPVLPQPTEAPQLSLER